MKTKAISKTGSNSSSPTSFSTQLTDGDEVEEFDEGPELPPVTDATRISNILPIKHEKHAQAPELAELAIYQKSKKFKSFEESLLSFKSNNVASFSELKAMKLIRSKFLSVVHFNQCAFSRIYPKGSRVDSSNFCPVDFWQAGSQ